MMQEQDDDVFDFLPDAILLEILNRVHDARSLSTSMSVCKRFRSLIPQIHTLSLSLTLPPPPPHHPTNKNHNAAAAAAHHLLMKPSNSSHHDHDNNASLLTNVLKKLFLKPIHFLLHHMGFFNHKKLSSSSDDDEQDEISFHGMLKNFNEARSLLLELPGHHGDISSNAPGGGALLKWDADFGSELESCVILGATSFLKSEDNYQDYFDNDNSSNKVDVSAASSILSGDELKLRVVWAISCLIAASARHLLLKQMVSEHPMIRDVVITDGSKQGRIQMQKPQVEELRRSCMDSGSTESSSETRTKVPALKMKMWYVPVELPASGYVMKGATLMVIRPAEENRSTSTSTSTSTDDNSNTERNDVDLAMGAFGTDGVDEGREKCFGEAVRKMIKKKKAYTLEMNSF